MSSLNKSVSVSDFSSDISEIKSVYKKVRKSFVDYDFTNLDSIFKIGLTKLELFTPIKIGKESTLENYFKKWIKKYFDDFNNEPKLSISDAKDEIIKKILILITNKNENSVDKIYENHNLCTAAENIQGKILERYINESIKDFKWYWCAGSIFVAIDFCSKKKFLQVKNKYNTENSSSSKIRENKSIIKWFRLNKDGKTNWDNLNKIINKKCSMSQEDYENYIKSYNFNM